MIQMRPKGSETQFFYSPERDLVHTMTFFMARAIWGISEGNREAWYADYLAFRDCKDEEIGKIAQAAAKYMQLTSDDLEIKTSFDALTAAGFFDTAPAAQVTLLAKLGQLVLTSYFRYCRESMVQDRDRGTNPSSLVLGMKELLAEAEAAVKKFNDTTAKKSVGFWQRMLNAWNCLRGK